MTRRFVPRPRHCGRVIVLTLMVFIAGTGASMSQTCNAGSVVDAVEITLVGRLDTSEVDAMVRGQAQVPMGYDMSHVRWTLDLRYPPLNPVPAATLLDRGDAQQAAGLQLFKEGWKFALEPQTGFRTITENGMSRCVLLMAYSPTRRWRVKVTVEGNTTQLLIRCNSNKCTNTAIPLTSRQLRSEESLTVTAGMSQGAKQGRRLSAQAADPCEVQLSMAYTEIPLKPYAKLDILREFAKRSTDCLRHGLIPQLPNAVRLMSVRVGSEP